MMGTIWFPVPALLAEVRKTNLVAHEDVLGIEVLYTRRRQNATV
jgi:hypothetical protein